MSAPNIRIVPISTIILVFKLGFIAYHLELDVEPKDLNKLDVSNPKSKVQAQTDVVRASHFPNWSAETC